MIEECGFFFFYLALCETKPTSTAGHANARICNRKTPIPKHPNLIKHFANLVPSSLCKSKTQIILKSSKIQQVFFCSVWWQIYTWTYTLAAGIISAFSTPTKPDKHPRFACNHSLEVTLIDLPQYACFQVSHKPNPLTILHYILVQIPHKCHWECQERERKKNSAFFFIYKLKTWWCCNWLAQTYEIYRNFLLLPWSNLSTPNWVRIAMAIPHVTATKSNRERWPAASASSCKKC